MINAHTKFEESSPVHSRDRKDDSKFKIRVGLALEWLGSFKVISNVTVWWSTCNFLFAFCSYVSILYNFQLVRVICQKSLIFPTQHAFGAPYLS